MSSLRDIMDVDVEPLPQTLRKSTTRERTTPDDSTADQLSPSSKEHQQDEEGKAHIKRRRSNRAGQTSVSEASSAQGESSSAIDSMDPNHQYGSSSHRQTSATSSTRHSSRGSDVPEGSIKYTPVTGRVSRAKKGQPVHVCDICKPSKTFTRAEHLRRHQLSHTKPAFPCTFQDCERAFHRPDLLARHMNRHETQGEKPYKASARNRSRASSAESSRTGTPLLKVEEQSKTKYSSSSEPITSRATGAPTATSSTTLNPQFQSINPSSPGPGEQSYPIDHQHHGDATVHVGAIFDASAPPVDDMISQISQITPRNTNQNYYSAQQSLFQIPTTFQFGSFPGGVDDSPNLQLQIPDQPYPALYDNNSSPWYSSDSPYSTPSDVSRSRSWDYRDRSVSIGTMPDIGYVPPPGMSRNAGLGNVYEEIDDLNYLSQNAGAQMAVQAQVGYNMEPGSVVRSSSRASNARLGGQSMGYRPKTLVEIERTDRYQVGWSTGAFRGQLEEYISSYWRFFDPLWPIIHRPTFNADTSPVLRLAMASLGTQFFGRSTDREIGSELHADCKRMIGLSTGPDTHSMQAILLTEIFARFRSRKIDIKPSKAFQALYDYLLGKIPHDYASPFSRIDADGLHTLLATRAPPEGEPDQSTRVWHEWITFEIRQRLRSACFTFDVHQSFYCEQTPTRPDVNVQTTEIIFPCPNEIWLAQDPEEWCDKISSGKYIRKGPIEDNSVLGEVEHSTYKQHLLICSLLSILPHRDLTRITPQTEAATDAIVTTFTNSAIAHTYLQFYHAPLRDLLTISGDSWIFGHKVKTHAEFDATKRRLYTWSTSPSAAKATWHACHVLKLALTHSRESCVSADALCAYWAVYSATLICWAFGHRKGISNVVDEKTLDPEATALAYVDMMSASKWQDLLAMPSNRGELAVVQVIKQRLELEAVGGKCGMLVDATVVLSRLVEGRGGKWF